MQLEVLRFASGEDSTIGALFLLQDVARERHFLCFVLEDQAQHEKVMGETRIPPGNYKLFLRIDGERHPRYAKRFPQIHKGVLQLLEVPGFTGIQIHCGNDDLDTKGCLLVGDRVEQNVSARGRLENSTAAYLRVYPSIAAALEAGKEVWIRYTDFDTPPQYRREAGR